MYKEYLQKLENLKGSKNIKVEFSVKDLEKFTDNLKKENADIRKFGNKMFEASADADASEKAINNQIKSIEKQTKELGLNITDIPAYKEAKTVLHRYDKLRKEFNL